MKELYGDNFSQAAIDHMQVLDEQRVSAAIRKAHAKPESDIEAEAVTVLFETLSFADLLDDAEVINEMEQALLKLSKHHDLALTEGGRYPGVYKLLAHHNASLRALVSILHNLILNPYSCCILFCISFPKPSLQTFITLRALHLIFLSVRCPIQV